MTVLDRLEQLGDRLHSRAKRRERKLLDRKLIAGGGEAKAYEDAKAFAAIAGAGGIAVEYGMAGDESEQDIAERFARAAYREPVRGSAFEGALAGFAEHRRSQGA